MLFITNRVLKQNNETQASASWTSTSATPNALQSLFFCERTAKDEYREVGSTDFMPAPSRTPPPSRFLGVHPRPFDNRPEDAAFPSGPEKLQAYLRRPPAPTSPRVVPIIWPCELFRRGPPEFIKGLLRRPRPPPTQQRDGLRAGRLAKLQEWAAGEHRQRHGPWPEAG